LRYPRKTFYASLPLYFWLLILAPAAWAQPPAVSQAVGAAHPLVDEFGEPLVGTDPEAYRFGITPAEGDLVQILQTTDNVIYPPDTDGEPDSRNIVLLTSRVGQGISPTKSRSGKFAAVLTPRPGGNTRLFVRVFNGATLEESSFYGDSQLFTVLSWKNEAFLADIEGTTLPLDPSDDDGDGLSNSMEQSLGTDPNGRDSDGDGLTDAEEAVTKTDPLDSESTLVFVEVQPAGDEDARLSWESKGGVMYRVEFTTDNLAQSPTFSVVATVEGGDTETVLIIEDGLADPHGCFRVWALAE